MNSNIFDELNEQQSKAVEYTDGPSIVLAGAGSGKTRVLTYKVLHLIHNENVDPSKIMMMTFTNKAAKEMQKRVGSTLGFIGTFHSFCAQVLRKDGQHVGVPPSYIIYDTDDTIALIKDILKGMTVYKKITPTTIKYKISSAKDNLLTPEQFVKFARNETDEVVSRVYKKYQARLEKNNAVDFDDLIFKTVELFRDHPEVRERYNKTFTHVLVDEFQDTNAAQYLLAKYLAQSHQNITAVGDFSQSIYSWRGADIQNLERFNEDFTGAKVFYLEQNYRSTQNVLDLAYEVISHNETHPILELYTENDEGKDITIKELFNEQDEAIFIAEEIKKLNGKESYDDVAVLYRTNAQSRVIEEAFLHYGIPYVLIGGTRFYERKEIKDMLAYIRLYINPEEEISLDRAQKIGKRRYNKLNELYKEVEQKEQEITTDDLIKLIFQRTGYLDMYDEEDPSDIPRIENLKELRSVAIRFEDVHEFLQQVALVESEYSQNEKQRKSKQGVKMMTLHQAKGLEFPYVFIVGAEEGLIPHSRSIYDRHQLEEERRLMYVGITRAEKKLYITYVQKRFMFGRRLFAQVSRFIEHKVEPSIPKTF